MWQDGKLLISSELSLQWFRRSNQNWYLKKEKKYVEKNIAFISLNFIQFFFFFYVFFYLIQFCDIATTTTATTTIITTTTATTNNNNITTNSLSLKRKISFSSIHLLCNHGAKLKKKKKKRKKRKKEKRKVCKCLLSFFYMKRINIAVFCQKKKEKKRKETKRKKKKTTACGQISLYSKTANDRTNDVPIIGIT